MESSPSRPARLTTAERKRITGRKVQRQRRERIKTYIARLEKTVEELTAASGNGIEGILLKQLEQQRLKTERLTNVINQIHEVLEEMRSSTPPGPESPPLLTQGEGNSPASATVSRSVLDPSEQQEQQRPTTRIINTDLASKILPHSQNPSNNRTRNYFQIVNESISNIANEKKLDYSVDAGG